MIFKNNHDAGCPMNKGKYALAPLTKKQLRNPRDSVRSLESAVEYNYPTRVDDPAIAFYS